MKTKKFLLISIVLVMVLSAACQPSASVEPNKLAQSESGESSTGSRNAPAAEEPALEYEYDGNTDSSNSAPERIDNQPLPTQAPTYEEWAEVEEGREAETLPQWDNRFEDYGVNPFIQTSRDHYSTFALDVDTGSYSVMRRYLNEGSLPPYNAVRVEEYVNYFDPGYAAPDGESFAIYADGAQNPFSQDETYLLRFGIQGYEVSDRDRKPANLTFVIDISGSMDMENRLGLVKDSLEYLVDQLREDDQVAIVVFGSRASVYLRPTAGDSTRKILSAIRDLSTSGSTNAEAGLRLGYRTALSMFDADSNNRVILCSDGVANVGITGPDGIMEEVQDYVDEGIYLTTVGFGMGNFNDVLMEQLADSGDGFYAYVDTIDEAKRLFIDEITSTLQVIARDAKVQVDFNADVVEAYRLVGYENRDVADEDFRNDTVDAGELGAGHHVVALYEVVLYPETNGRIGTVQLRFENPDTAEITEINGNFNTWDLTERFEETSDEYQLAVLVMQYAEILRESPWAWDVSMHDLRLRMDKLARAMRDEDASEFADLVYEAEQLLDSDW